MALPLDMTTARELLVPYYPLELPAFVAGVPSTSSHAVAFTSSHYPRLHCRPTSTALPSSSIRTENWGKRMGGEWGRNGQRAGFFAKWPRGGHTVARPRQIMELAWLTLDRSCAVAIDEGSR